MKIKFFIIVGVFICTLTSVTPAKENPRNHISVYFPFNESIALKEIKLRCLENKSRRINHELIIEAEKTKTILEAK